MERASPATKVGGNWPALRTIEEDIEYRSMVVHEDRELGFEADGGVAPGWLPDRSRPPIQCTGSYQLGGRRVGDYGAQLVLAPLVLRPSLEASVSKVANVDEMSF